ncbi:STAS/SEC14 domain-containing protein [Qipengyuania sp. RANM35]|uniref:STAS/SEC14 domain-containing protein n=1 Tax=Qipengyuania sp. RANM35 TaxID=3068635 RepID=UPI0034DB0A95
MIDIDLSHEEFVILRPKGALSEQDFADLAAAIDSRINETDRVPNLLISVEGLPHWDSVGALARHFHFVKEHQKIVEKVAVVGDSPLLSLAPEIANLMTKAIIRRFPSRKMEDAKAWLRASEDDPGRFEVIEGLPRDVIAVRAVGIITAQDYHDVLIPLVENRLKDHDKLKLLFVMGDNYTTFSGDAAWEDTKFDLRHVRDFTRIAMVTDVPWLVRTARIFRPIVPYTFEVFPMEKLEDAKDWIKR